MCKHEQTSGPHAPQLRPVIRVARVDKHLEAPPIERSKQRAHQMRRNVVADHAREKADSQPPPREHTDTDNAESANNEQRTCSTAHGVVLHTPAVTGARRTPVAWADAGRRGRPVRRRQRRCASAARWRMEESSQQMARLRSNSCRAPAQAPKRKVVISECKDHEDSETPQRYTLRQGDTAKAATAHTMRTKAGHSRSSSSKAHRPFSM